MTKKLHFRVTNKSLDSERKDHVCYMTLRELVDDIVRHRKFIDLQREKEAQALNWAHSPNITARPALVTLSHSGEAILVEVRMCSEKEYLRARELDHQRIHDAWEAIGERRVQA